MTKMKTVRTNHNWVAIFQVSITEKDVVKVLKNGNLDNDTKLSDLPVQVGCYDCERDAGEALGKLCYPVEEEE